MDCGRDFVKWGSTEHHFISSAIHCRIEERLVNLVNKKTLLRFLSCMLHYVSLPAVAGDQMWDLTQNIVLFLAEKTL